MLKTCFVSESGNTRIDIYQDFDENFNVEFTTYLNGFPNLWISKQEVNFSSFHTDKNMSEFFNVANDLKLVLSCDNVNYFESLKTVIKSRFISTFELMTGEKLIQYDF